MLERNALHVRGTGGSYAVFRGNKRVSQHYVNRTGALERLDREQRKEQSQTRPCLRCQKPFLSEGIHNRLCNPCRSMSSAEMI